MLKILKKAQAYALSAAIAATMAAVPITAGAYDATISYSGGYATTSASGKLIAASYSESGMLTGIHIYDAQADIPVAVAVSEGDKLMLWDGLDGQHMKPLADVYEVECETPTTAPTESATDAPEELNIINTWKFDFGSAEDVAEGYTAVTADRNFVVAGDYGFIGTNEKDYKLAGGRVDGFIQQEGQVIELTAGGSTGLSDGIGSTGADQYGNAGDKFYPVRFALKTEDEKYFRVKAYVTTLDPSKDAEASLYTERKHPLYTYKTIKAGETEVTEFTVRTTPIYYEKSDPKGAAADGMVNVCVLGENTALAALDIYEIDTAPVLWVLGDSTVTDGDGTLPFWPLQNYTGVGTGLTKYLPKNIAMVNEGEGGLAAGDNYHFNMVKNRIKAGDFMYVEYGHNHKTDGVDGYKSHLDKYYNACQAVGATLILVGPIDRHNDSQYNPDTNTWSTTLGGFSTAAKAYVDGKIAAGATDVAFVDLNQPSLDWYTELTKGGVVGGTGVTNNIRLTDYYFRGALGTSHSGVDGTHPNDAGAENLAYFFYATADTGAYPALAPLMTRYKAGKAETPKPVPQYVLDAGWAGNSTWPTYVTVTYDYPIVIKNIKLNENNEFTTLTAYVQDDFANYASGVLVITDVDGETTHTYVTTNHIDNTTGKGNNELTFPSGIVLEGGQTYTAYMWSCSLDEERLLTEEEGGEKLSADYVPADINAYILPGDDSDIETFSYYGVDVTKLTSTGKYKSGGSAGIDCDLGTEDNRTYTNVSVSSKGNSYYIWRALENLDGGTGIAGRYLFDADIMYLSGAGLTVSLSDTMKNSSPFIGNALQLFTIGNNGDVTVNGVSVGTLTASNWINLHYILDMYEGTATVSIGGGDAKAVELPALATFNVPAVSTYNYFVFDGGKQVEFATRFSNMTVAKLKDSAANKTFTVEVAQDCAGFGTVSTGDGTSVTAPVASAVTATAAAASGYRFIGWYNGDELFSEDAEVTVARLYKDLTLSAKFVADTAPASVTINYVDGDDNEIKASEVITEVDSKTIYSGDAFTLVGDAYTAAIKIADGDLYDVYVYDSEKSDTFTIDSLAVENTINVVYNKLDGKYFDYEDFSDPSIGTWGFTAGKGGNVATADGILYLFKNAGTSAQGSDVKTLDSVISSATKLTVSFDWKNGVENGKGRNSLFNLYDSNNNYVFSLNGRGNAGIAYAIGEAAGNTKNVTGSVNDWYRVVLTIDFTDGKLSGTITDLVTNAVTDVPETAITATNLASIHADYGYSAAPQYLDNIGFRNDSVE